MVAASPQVIQQIGELTRMLHDTIEQLGVVNVGVMPELQAATSALPDARSRLNYIANKTSDAANRVLNSVDDAKLEHQRLMSESRSIAEAIAADTSLAADLRERVGQHIDRLNGSCDRIDEHLTNIMMAQDFHDLTGQIIKKVVRVTNELEANLVKLLLDLHPEQVEQAIAEVATATPAPATSAAPPLTATAQPSELEGPVVDGNRTDVVTDQHEVDDLLARMGF
jgi:chemotaxis protein CheZ